MPPKEGVNPPSVLSSRPQTPNDLAILETESSLSSVAGVEKKWKQRQQSKGDEKELNDTRTTVIEVGIQLGQRMLRTLDSSVEKLLQKPEQTEEKPKKPPQSKNAPPVSEEPSVAHRPSDITDLTTLLLKYYRLELTKIKSAPTAVHPLAVLLKSEATKAVDAYREDDDNRKMMNLRSITAMADDPPLEARADESLSQPRGLSKPVWDQLQQLRSRRIQILEACEQLERELAPLVTRNDGLVSMSSITQYALSATLREKLQLKALLKEQEIKRSEEIAIWNGSNPAVKTGKK